MHLTWIIITEYCKDDTQVTASQTVHKFVEPMTTEQAAEQYAAHKTNSNSVLVLQLDNEELKRIGKPEKKEASIVDLFFGEDE